MPLFNPPSRGYLPLKVPSGQFAIPAMTGTNYTGAAGVADRMDLAPFVPAHSFDCDQLSINCTTAVGSALAKIVAYDADDQGYPNNLLHESANLDMSTTGAKTSAVALRFEQGRMYWLGVRSSSTAAHRAQGASSSPVLSSTLETSTAGNTGIRRSLAFASPAPSPWVFDAAELATIAVPIIFARAG